MSGCDETMKDSERWIHYIPALREVLTAQGAWFGVPWDDERDDRLRYACSHVRPATHLELAFVVAAAERHVWWREIVEEFVKRRAGERTVLDHFPILELEEWGMPNTYRIPAFHEQIVALIRTVSGWGILAATGYLYEIFKRRADRKPLRAIASSDCREKMGPDELDAVEAIVLHHATQSRQYAWCSTMAERAQRLVDSAAGFHAGWRS